MEAVFFIIVFAIWIAPMLILLLIAMNKGRSKHFAWWAVGSWLGFLIGAIIMLLGPTERRGPGPGEAEVERRGDRRSDL